MLERVEWCCAGFLMTWSIAKQAALCMWSPSRHHRRSPDYWRKRLK
jgi:hypothetical protein